MWVMILVFMGNFGSVSTEQVSWYGTQQDCETEAAKINIQPTTDRPYTIVAECFASTGYAE